MATNSFGMMVTPSADSIETLLRGSIDMHIHPGPDPSTCRGYDIIETAQEAAAYGMQAIVVKSFFFPTTDGAYLACKAVPSVTTFGSVTIGYATTGGLDYAATVIETQAKLGCKVLWFPAFDAENCKKALNRTGGIYILDGDGKLDPRVYGILKIAKEYNLVVCNGHMSYRETIELFRAAKELGIQKLVTTHPLVEIWPAFSTEELQACVDCGAVIEFTYGPVLPRNGSVNPRSFVECAKHFGAEHCIMSTDGSQITDPSPALCMRLHIAMMLQFGCSEEEVRLMTHTIPESLLDLK